MPADRPPRRTSRFSLLVLAAALLVALAVVLAGCSNGGGSDGAVASGEGGSATTVAAIQAANNPYGAQAGTLSGNFVRCPECHSKLDIFLKTSTAITPNFSHGLHFKAGATCSDCHPSPTHTEAEVRKPDMLACFKCHSQSDKTKPPGECAVCHPKSFPLVPKSHADPLWIPPRDQIDSVKAKHAVNGQAKPKECALCHAPSFCLGCHKVPMPHPASWKQNHGPTARKAGEQSCDQCHPNKNSCNRCHHPGFNPQSGTWVQQHKLTVAETGPEACFKCHSSATCAHCHVTGEYKAY